MEPGYTLSSMDIHQWSQHMKMSNPYKTGDAAEGLVTDESSWSPVNPSAYGIINNVSDDHRSTSKTTENLFITAAYYSYF